MIYETLSLQKIDHIIVIEIAGCREDQAKAIRQHDEMMELCEEIAWDKELRVVVLTGKGEKALSFGTNLIDPGSLNYWGPRFASWAEPISNFDQPVIAAIQGDATGQGLELVLACDIRIATEASRFGLPHIEEGLIPWDGGTQRLPRLIGRAKALEMILTGEMIDAQEAYRIGLVNKVVPLDKLITVAMDMAKEIASKGPIALRYAKEAVYKGMDMTLEQGLRLEADLYLLIHTTKDRTEGIRAFQEKRTSKFEGK